MRPGRPTGTKRFEPEPARAFGMAVRALRLEKSIGQEALGAIANIDRSHMSKIERGVHMPTLAVILHLAKALECDAAVLIAETEKHLKEIRASNS